MRYHPIFRALTIHSGPGSSIHSIAAPPGVATLEPRCGTSHKCLNFCALVPNGRMRLDRTGIAYAGNAVGCTSATARSPMAVARSGRSPREQFVRIFVTGGAGFISSVHIRHLIQSTTYEVLKFEKSTYASALSTVERIANSNRKRFLAATAKS